MQAAAANAPSLDDFRYLVETLIVSSIVRIDY